MLESAEISESSIAIGNAPPGYLRAAALDLDSYVAAAIDLKPDGMGGGFYVTSWLMTHYLLLDSENAPRRRASLLDYLRRFDAGEDPIEAFSESFGIAPVDMQREIEAYGRRRALTVVSLPREAYRGELTQRALTKGEDLYRLGDIAAELDAFEAAHGYFQSFEETAGDSPFLLNVRSRRAIVYIHEDRIDEADALIEQLLAMEIGDADVLADIAHYSFDRFVHESDSADELARTYLDQSIDYGERAVEKNPDDVEALYYLGLAHEAAGNLQLAADALFRSHDINPSAPRLNIALVRVMLKGQQPEVASYLVSRLYSASHSEEARARLLELQQAIATGDVDLTNIGDF
jgi:tetratricopeptide (TPR) repeat protein